MKWLFGFMVIIGSAGFIRVLIFVIVNETVLIEQFDWSYIGAVGSMLLLNIGLYGLSKLSERRENERRIY